MSTPKISNRDFKTRLQRPRPKLRRGHVHALAIISGIIGLVALLSPSHDAEATRNAQLQAPSDPVTFKLPLPGMINSGAPGPRTSPTAEGSDGPTARRQWQTVTVKSGDTLYKILKEQGLSDTAVHSVASSEHGKMLTQLRPGQTLQFELAEGKLLALRYKSDSTTTLLLDRSTEGGYVTKLLQKKFETRKAYASGEITGSLYSSALAAGLSDNLIMELVNIFAWDIDFALDIRKGDHFSIAYEEKFLNGEKYKDGDILAAEFVNRGKTYRAVRFTDPKGRTNYYDPDGRSMRKAFLRSPVDFRRISSRFQPERYHPILGRKRPHQGVDYAAATGTPIKASGDGKIIFRGWKGGYGRTIIIKHGGRYSTLYAHMSRFRGGLHVGSRVRQGQTVGYVGQSGLATGPHLHYEFRVNGVHRNPLTVKLPNAAPINAAYMDDFSQEATVLLGQLRVYDDAQVAEAR